MEQVLDTALGLLLTFPIPVRYLAFFTVLLVCGLGLPIPEDITLGLGGYAAYSEATDLWPTIVICFIGVLLGDSIIFFLGARFGRRLTKKWFFHKLLPDERLDAVKVQFHTKGNKLIFAARFMPGLRAPIFFSAGTLHLPYRIFLFYDGVAALLSVPAIVGAVYYFGYEVEKIFKTIKKIEHGILITIALIILAIITKWYISHRRIKKT